MYYQYISLYNLRFQISGFWKTPKLKGKCSSLFIFIMLLISTHTKPYLPAELTPENLSAVLTSSMYRLGHVPENAVKMCYVYGSLKNICL